jgi:Xaa-Pro aminopeptidase
VFSAATYLARRRRLCELVGEGLVLLPGHADSPRNFADNCYPFRQDSTFLYYFGLAQPDLVGLIDTDTGQAVIYGDELTIDHIVWMGDLPTIAERAASVGVDSVRPLAQLAEDLAKGRPVHFLPPYRAQTRAQLQDWLGGEATVSVDLIKAVVAQRSIKSDEEIAEITRAVDISVDMHIVAMQMVRPGMMESEVAAEVERVAVAAGGGLAFAPIATVNGQILHNHHHGNTVAEGDLFLLDAGAETAMGYAGDLSSTFPVSAHFTSRQKWIYELSLQAHEAAVTKLAPGVTNLEVHLAAARTIARGMKDLGLMRGDTEEAVAAGAHAMFFPCGVGHMMGLDVHDMENLGEEYVGYDGQAKSTQFGLKSLRLGRTLEPGFVLTIEPGIYFIPQLMDRWRAEGLHHDFLDYDELDRWRDYGGIRNEEDYLITAEGARRLGKPKPMTVAEVEALRQV